jgi:hypothetical protein
VVYFSSLVMFWHRNFWMMSTWLYTMVLKKKSLCRKHWLACCKYNLKRFHCKAALCDRAIPSCLRAQ